VVFYKWTDRLIGGREYDIIACLRDENVFFRVFAVSDIGTAEPARVLKYGSFEFPMNQIF
jgi:hypothetical protein